MVKSITLLKNKQPVIEFPAPFLMESPFVILGFAHTIEGGDRFLVIAVIYGLEDVLEGRKYDVAKYESGYKIVSEGIVTAEDLYPACQQAVNSLQVFLDFHVRFRKIPQKSIHVPELSHVKEDLQIEADWFSSL